MVPDKVIELVERFRENEAIYRAPNYKEAHIRQDFIDPFFAELGWDLRNEQGAPEIYKEVIFEDAIKIAGSMKAPDYCFRIGGDRKFFVEAKKPAVNLLESASAAYQVRRYGWSAKLPVCILTDFEEFVVYDCRIIPNKHDFPTTARSFYLPYGDYLNHWDKIYALFSKEAVLAGSLEQFADETKTKKGSITVDAAFLKEIESWRERLAIALSTSNPTLSQRELNFAVQMTINRLIFLRIGEDRGIEPYEQLQSLTQHERVYEQLCRLFQQADSRYNSGLFHFKPEKNRPEPDEFTLSLTIPDEPLQQIIQNLYYPDSPYEFSVIPVEILGQVYEQFLGKVIRLTPDHQAIVESKPEVRKAGGVYYTPTYIVDYIVQNTIGRLLEGKTPKQAEKIRVLDPACGSGSFLIGAYQFLLDWYLQQYVANPTKQHKKKFYQGSGGILRLTSEEKKRILLNHIHGVDIDLQAVETTKLSLLLKVLEGESQETLFKQLSLLRERALPDLEKNIKCGNSLIGSDYYENIQMSLLSQDEIYRINVFDWEDGFPEIMQTGGFDVVIGNPPYVRQESLSSIKKYISRHYKTYDSAADLYIYFVEKSISLLRACGIFSFIVSSSFLRTTYGIPLRNYLCNNSKVSKIVDFEGLAVFSNAKDTYVCIPILSKETQTKRVEICKVKTLRNLKLDEYFPQNSYEIDSSQLTTEAWILDKPERVKVFKKIKKYSITLSDYVNQKIFRGILTGLNDAFEIDRYTRQGIVEHCPESEILIKHFLGGQNIRRYELNDEEKYLIVIPSGWTSKQIYLSTQAHIVSEDEAWHWFSNKYSLLSERLEAFKDAAKRRQDKGQFWWELRSCDYYTVLNQPKIIYPDIAKFPRFYLDTEGIYIANTAYCLGTDDRYLLGILNSKLFWFAISCISIPFGTRAGEFRYRLIYQYMEKAPIRVIDFDYLIDKIKHDRMVQLVDQMLFLHKQLSETKAPPQRSMIQKQISVTDRQIDKLVYELYGLTNEEINIVERREANS